MTAFAERFLRARTIDEACAWATEQVDAGHAFRFLAGGTDLVVEAHLPAKGSPAELQALIDLSSVAELATIEDRGDRIRLGGGVTYLALRRDPIAQRIPLLAKMAREVGAIQIQARGTLAGNLATASPAADGGCALAALDATVGLRSVRGERVIALSEFHVGYRKTARAPDELVAFVEVRVPRPHARWFWRKVGTRRAQAISKVALAAVGELDGDVVAHARFGMASVAATTAFLPSVRAAIEGRARGTLSNEEIEAALARDVTPIDDVRSTGDYRRHVARALVGAFVERLRA
jgi:CO/xanthine dehydrogenase FAD-binding subunit